MAAVFGSPSLLARRRTIAPLAISQKLGHLRRVTTAVGAGTRPWKPETQAQATFPGQVEVHIQKPRPHGLEVRIRSMGGNMIARLRDATAGWTRIDVLRALADEAPLQPHQVYRLFCGNQMLRDKAPLAEYVGRIEIAEGSRDPLSGYVKSTEGEDPTRAIELTAVITEVNSDAMAALAQAKQEICLIQKKDLREVQAFAYSILKPPEQVELLIEAVCAVLGLKEGFCFNNTWSSTKCVLADLELLSKLHSFDPTKSPGKTLLALSPYLKVKDFTEEALHARSQTYGLLCAWCHRLHDYCKGAEAAALDLST